VRGALLAGVAAAAAAWPAAAPVPPVVFSSTGPPELVAPHWYTSALDGSARRRLAFPGDGELAPDGRLVARIGGTALAPMVEVLPAQGPARTVARFPGRLRVEVTGLVWSPDSRHLAVATACGCGSASGRGTSCAAYEVWTAAAAGGRLVRAARGRQPAWSAGSRRLAFVRYSARLGGDSVFVAPAAGSRERVLVRGAQPVWAPHGGTIAYLGPRGLADGASGAPLWSPDGRRLAFVHVAAGAQRLETVDVRTGAL
jgi:Tol biopolymer transport system component